MIVEDDGFINGKELKKKIKSVNPGESAKSVGSIQLHLGQTIYFAIGDIGCFSTGQWTFSNNRIIKIFQLEY